MRVARQIGRLGQESVVYGLSGVVQKAIGVLLIPLYTRVFAPSEYGVMSLIGSVSSLLGPLAVLGLDNSAARWFYDTEDRLHQRNIIASWFWAQFVVSLCLALLVSAVAPQVAQVLLGSTRYALLIVLAATAMPLAAFSKVLGSLLRYQRRAWASSLYATVTATATIILTVWFVLLRGWQLTGIYAAALAGASLAAVVGAVLLRGWVSPTSFSWTQLKPMLRFGLPLVPAAVATWLTTSSDRLILRMFRSESEIGLYSLAFSLASVLGLAVGAFQMAFGPFAFSIHREEGSGRVYAATLLVYSWGACFLATALSLFAPLAFRVFTTPEYYGASSCVPYLCFSYVLLGVRDIASMGAAIAKRSGPVAISILICAAISVAANFLLVPSLGKDGAGLASMTAYLVSTAYLFAASQRAHPLPYSFGRPLACFGFAWLLIGLDRVLPIPHGVTGYAIRAGMCLLFVPWAFALKIARPSHVRAVLAAISLRTRGARP
jgi:O-antigen/teichoic acid export membrane protein